MSTNTTPVRPNVPEPPADQIPAGDRLVLWMFVLGVILFALLLLGDMFVGLVQ